jgi:hypothetical protein
MRGRTPAPAWAEGGHQIEPARVELQPGADQGIARRRRREGDQPGVGESRQPLRCGHATQLREHRAAPRHRFGGGQVVGPVPELLGVVGELPRARLLGAGQRLAGDEHAVTPAQHRQPRTALVDSIVLDSSPAQTSASTAARSTAAAACAADGPAPSPEAPRRVRRTAAGSATVDTRPAAVRTSTSSARTVRSHGVCAHSAYSVCWLRDTDARVMPSRRPIPVCGVHGATVGSPGRPKVNRATSRLRDPFRAAGTSDSASSSTASHLCRPASARRAGRPTACAVG